MAGLLGVIVIGLFHKSLNPDYVVFSNDGPLGAQVSERRAMPGPMTGFWNPLNWAGYAGPTASPHFTNMMVWLLGPVGWAKFYVPLAQVLLGLSAAFFLRQVGLTFAAACLGGLAAALNSEFLSTACWGLPTWCMSFAFAYLAIGALANASARYRWLRVILAGAATGMCVMEGYDVGAIFSLAVAAFAAYQALAIDRSAMGIRVTKGVATTALVAAFAGLVAAHTVTTLVGTQVKGVVGMEQDAETKALRWASATQWSLPKQEVLSVAVPGLYGYRMDTREGGNYWGRIGRAPNWNGDPRSARFVGSGFYCGVFVVVIALWAALQALRGEKSVFSGNERRWIWFWSGLALISTLLAFGKFAPFYKVIYALPFFSTIRNPVKFMHVLSWALVVLFAYGVHGLIGAYVSRAKAGAATGSGWRSLCAFDRRWIVGTVVVFIVAGAAWMVFRGAKARFEAFLETEAIGPGLASQVATSSIGAVGMFVGLLLVAVLLVALMLTGRFRGIGPGWTAVVLGVCVVIDLGQAAKPWIVHVDYKKKYASNAVMDFLRDKPYEHRAIGLPFEAPGELGLVRQLYTIEWAQHHFQYYNIQSLDVVQMSRPPRDIARFDAEFPFQPVSEDAIHKMPRRWELTNTRYLIGPAGFLDVLNTQLDPGKERFSLALLFNIVPKAGVREVVGLEDLTVVPSDSGPYALIEFSGALPRAKLYTQWQVETNLDAVYSQLADPSFDPASMVVVSGEVPSSPVGVTNGPPAEVEIISYGPKRVELQAEAQAPAILLLNDKHDPNWKVTVDGTPVDLLLCNAVMRGVYLEPGKHRVEFAFKPSLNALYVTVSAMLGSVGLLCFVTVTRLRMRDNQGAGRAAA